MSYEKNKIVEGSKKKKDKNRSLSLRIYFPSKKLKYVTQRQAYGFGNFGADVGGYIGMFLGYSLLHIPHMVLAASKFISNMFSHSLSVG